MSNRSPSVSPLASPLRRMQAAGVTGRINPYCSRRANFRSVKEVKACLAAISDVPSMSKKTKSPVAFSSFSIKTPPSRRATHNVITPEARTMMKEAVAEFSSPLTDVKKIPMRESPIFPIPASKRRKLFDMKDEILREVEKNKARIREREKAKLIREASSGNVKQANKDAKQITEIQNHNRQSCEQELLQIQKIYPEFKFSAPSSLRIQTNSDNLLRYNDEFVFSNAVCAKQAKTSEVLQGSSLTSEVPATEKHRENASKDKSESSDPIITIDKELAERFKPPKGSWECEVCMINNKSDVSVCIACTADKPTPKSAVPKSCIEPDKELIARFRMGADKWECDTCMIQNSQSDEKCLACEAAKPGAQSKVPNPVISTSKPTITQGLSLNIKPNESSSTTLPSFGGGMKIPGFSLDTFSKKTTNPISLSSLLASPLPTLPKPSTPGNVDFGLSLLKPSTTNSTLSLPPSTISTSSSTIPLFKPFTTSSTLYLPPSTINTSSTISLFKPSPAVKTVTTNTSTPDLSIANTVSSASHSIETTVASTSTPNLINDTATLPPSLPASKLFPTMTAPNTSQSKYPVTTTTNSLSLTQSTPSLQPTATLAHPTSPPRTSHLQPPMPPVTPQKSVDEEAMEVIPFSGTLTTPVKGTSSVPTNSPFNFLASNPNPSVPTIQPQAPQRLASPSVTPANESLFQGVNPRFSFSTPNIPQTFQFGGNPATAPRPVTDNSTGQDLKPFQFRAASSQPVPQFALANNPPQSNSQPDNFSSSQPGLNLFNTQSKPTTLFPQPAAQPPSTFGGVTPTGSMFNSEPQKVPSNNLFKQTTTPSSFQFAPKSQTPLFSPGANFQFAASPSTTPVGGVPFPFGSGGQQANTSQTPQTQAGYNFNVGSSDVKNRVIKVAKRRHK